MEHALEYVIEDTPVLARQQRARKYPFDKMKVGQSFYLAEGFKEIKSVRTAAANFGKRNGMKFSIVRDGSGYRCGRVK